MKKSILLLFLSEITTFIMSSQPQLTQEQLEQLKKEFKKKLTAQKER